MHVMAGEDLHALSVLCLGGTGVISAASHLRPDLFVAMYNAVQAQSLDRARALFQALAPVIRLAFEEPNPGPIKAQLAGLTEHEGVEALAKGKTARLLKVGVSELMRIRKPV